MERRSSEMDFTLPVGPADGGAALTPKALAALFARHPGSAIAQRYARHLRALGFPPLAGFLRGSIDLVFEHERRFWLIDWKSNRLGSRASDYGREALAEIMNRHHYVLQYHLYVATLDRYLRHRRPGYDYERDFGGVLYVFLRGVGGDGRGVFFDRPPAALVKDLSGLLEFARAEETA
jgi:exodeoxyribonuclease V beta subunit